MAFPRQVPFIPGRSEFHTLETDVVYDEVGGEPLRYDLYRPTGAGTAGPVPGVVFVHGGGWVNGDPSQAAGNALHFVRAGIATVSISYRLAPAHRFPAQLDDVRRGLRHVRRNAAALGIDPERLILFGVSAGAHLALLAHLVRGERDLEPALPAELAAVSEDVLAVIAHYGPYDLARRRPTPVYDPIGSLLGARVDDPAFVRLASPLQHAAGATAPVLLIHGTADDLVSHRESEHMHAALLAAGKTSELLLLDGAPHAFQMDWKGAANRRANAAMDTFLGHVIEVASRV
jgi:acetyl esterase/lipase